MKALRRNHRLAIAAAWSALVVVAGGALTARLALRPEAVEARARALVAGAFRVPVTFASFRFGWLRGGELRDIRIGGAPADEVSGPGDVLRVSSLRVVPRLSGLLRGRLEVAAIAAEVPRLDLRREAGGRWNLEDAIEPAVLAAISRGGPGRGGWPSVRVRAALVTIRDARGFPGVEAIDLEDLEVRFAPSGDSVRVSGTARVGPAWAELSGSLRPGPDGLSARCALRLGGVDATLVLDRLPPDLARAVAPWSPKGLLDGTVELEVPPGGAPRIASGAVRLSRGGLTTPRLPYPAEDLSGEIRLGDRFVEVSRLEGRIGKSRVSVRGRAEVPAPWAPGATALAGLRWSLEAQVRSAEIEPRTVACLPAGLRMFHERYRPWAFLDVDLALDGTLDRKPVDDDIRASVRFEGGTIEYSMFPYPLHDVRGEVRVEHGRFFFPEPIVGRAGPTHVSLSGPGGEIRRYGDVDLTLDIRSMPLDERLRRALPPKMLETWDALQVAGTADGEVRVWRQSPRLPGGAEFVPDRPEVRILAYPKDMRVCHRRFPYEVAGIVGKLDIDANANRVVLEGLRGRHGNAVVTADGSHSHGDPYDLKLAIGCDALPLDRDLIDALPPSDRLIVEDFGLEGTVRARLDVRATEPRNVQVSADLSVVSARIRNRHLPYEIEVSDGSLRLAGDRSVEWSGISTPAGSKPYVVLGGRLEREASRSTLRLNVDFSELEVDDKLRAALPPHLERVTTNMGLGGTFQGRVEIVHALDETLPAWREVRYEGKGFRVQRGSVDFGLKVRELEATGSFVGEAGEGGGALRGDVRVESGRFNRLRLSKGRVDFVVGKGLEALLPNGEATPRYTPGPYVRERLAAAGKTETLQLLIRTDDLYGGTADGLVFVNVGTGRQFGGELVGKGLQVSRAAGDIFETTSRAATGRIRGEVRFTGNNRDQSTITGEGRCVVEEARLADVPLFLDVGSLLFGAGFGSGYFNGVRLAFRIADGKFVAAPPSGVEISSPTVTLAGGGTMDFRGNLDLMLETQVIQLRIPIVDELLSLLKKGLARISVVGNLSKPRAQFVTGAGMLRIGLPAGGAERPGAPSPPATPEVAPDPK